MSEQNNRGLDQPMPLPATSSSRGDDEQKSKAKLPKLKVAPGVAPPSRSVTSRSNRDVGEESSKNNKQKLKLRLSPGDHRGNKEKPGKPQTKLSLAPASDHGFNGRENSNGMRTPTGTRNDKKLRLAPATQDGQAIRSEETPNSNVFNDDSAESPPDPSVPHASPVDDDNGVIVPHATKDDSNNHLLTTKQQVMLVTFVLVVTGGTAASLLLTREETKEPIILTTSPSATPSISPSQEPTSEPSTFRYGIIANVLSHRLAGVDMDDGIKWLVETDTWYPPTDAINPDGLWKDRYSIAALYFAANGQEWQQQQYMLTSRHVCDWHTTLFSCNSDRLVIRMDIAAVAFQGGGLPTDAFVDMLSLQELNLLGSNGSGPQRRQSLPRLPANIRRCYYGWTTFFGTIPEDYFADLTELTYLSIGQNELWGSIPRLPTSLEVFRIEQKITEISGIMDGNLTELTNLKDLKIAETAMAMFPSLPPTVQSIDIWFSGVVPRDAFEALTQLTTLSIDGGPGGLIPLFPSSLQNIDIDGRFQFKVPSDAFAYLSSLTSLKLVDNSLTGTIPPLPSSLVYCYLQDNLFETVPDHRFVALTNLRTLDVNSNLIRGSIPRLPPSIVNVDMSSNRISGSIPQDYFSELSVLSRMHLDVNNMTGTIPSPVPSSLTTLELDGNNFSGSFPDLTQNIIDNLF